MSTFRLLFLLLFLLSKQPANQFTRGLYGFHREIDHPVDRLIDRSADRLNDLLDRIGDAADVKQRGEETENDGNSLGQRILDRGSRSVNLSFGDGGDRIDDGVDQHHDLVDALDKELDDLVNRHAGLEESSDRIQQAEQPLDARLDQLGDYPTLDLFDNHLLEVADLFLDVLPHTCGTFLDQNHEDFSRGLQRSHHVFAQNCDCARADVGIGEPQNLHHQTQDAFEVKVVRKLNSSFGHGPKEPVDEALFEVFFD